MNRTITICSPGYGASCALCCGSHNANASIDAIEEHYLRKRDIPSPQLAHTLHEKNSIATLFNDGMNCPFVGFIHTAHRIIGCTIYETIQAKNDHARDPFFETCRYFYCKAWDILSDEEVLFAAQLTSDWYFYSLLIQDIPTVRRLYKEYHNPKLVPSSEFQYIKERLKQLLSE